MSKIPMIYMWIFFKHLNAFSFEKINPIVYGLGSVMIHFFYMDIWVFNFIDFFSQCIM